MTNTDKLFQIYLMLVKNYLTIENKNGFRTNLDCKQLDQMFEQANLINDTFNSKNNGLNKSKEELQLLLETKNEEKNR